MKTSYEYQRAEIEKQASIAGINISFSSYSAANGLSIYFIDADGVKYRFSDHGISNPVRMATEKTFALPFQKKLGLGGKITEMHNQLFN